MNLRVILAGWTLCALMVSSPVFGAAIITDFNPIAGSPGDQVQLTGSGFTSGGITVQFWNGLPAPVLFINSDTIMTVQVPSGVTTGPISIQQGAGPASFTANDFLAVGPGPYITGTSPAFASVNDTVTISGVHFAGTTAVLFNGTNALTFTPNAAGTQITTRVPPGATSGLITVSTPNGTTNSPASFTVVGAGPYIADFTPTFGVPGTKVQIDGVHFTGVTNVTFNGMPSLILSAASDSLVQVQAPTGLLTGPIVISTPLGTFVTSSNFFGNPVITALSPAFGRTGTNVSISGTNLLGASAVSFGGIASVNFSVVNNSNLIAVVPPGAKTGLVRVIVPGASAFSPTNFVVRPTISGFAPAFGAVGTSITITGANLNATSATVSFNGIPAAAPTGVMFGQLTVQVPNGATTGRISITTSDGGDTNATLFYLPATIAGFTPTNSAAGSRITLSGQNFIGTSVVSFGGQGAAGVDVTNNTTMGVTVPPNAITGPISITTPAGPASSVGLFYGSPIITNFTPTHGLPGASVTINGINFLGGKVQFGSLAAAIVSLNNNQAVAKVPAGAQTGPISIITPGGTNTSAGLFTLDYTSDLQAGTTNSQNRVTVGSNLLYTVSVFNAGPNAAPNATVSNLLPATVSLRAVTISPSWVLATNGNALIASTASFGSGGSFVMTILVTPQASGSITNTVSVTSDNPDPVPSDNVASVTTVVEPLALLSIGQLGNLVRVSWPASLTNYVLESRDSLSLAPSWLTVTNLPVIEGPSVSVTETNNGVSRFYRLQR